MSPPDSYDEALAPDVLVYGGGALALGGRQVEMRSEDGTVWDQHPYKKRKKTRSSLSHG